MTIVVEAMRALCSELRNMALKCGKNNGKTVLKPLKVNLITCKFGRFDTNIFRRSYLSLCCGTAYVQIKV